MATKCQIILSCTSCCLITNQPAGSLFFSFEVNEQHANPQIKCTIMIGYTTGAHLLIFSLNYILGILPQMVLFQSVMSFHFTLQSFRFCRNTSFEASQVVLWSLSCYKELKLTTNPFAKFRHAQKAKFRVLTFTFRFLTTPLFSLFLPHFLFSCWAFSRLHFGGKSSQESFQDLRIR